MLSVFSHYQIVYFCFLLCQLPERYLRRKREFIYLRKTTYFQIIFVSPWNFLCSFVSANRIIFDKFFKIFIRIKIYTVQCFIGLTKYAKFYFLLVRLNIIIWRIFLEVLRCTEKEFNKIHNRASRERIEITSSLIP